MFFFYLLINETKVRKLCVSVAKRWIKIRLIPQKIVLSPQKLKEQMELSGKIIAVLPAREGVSKAGNPWKTQEYVLETHDQYPRKMCFNIFGADKITQFDIKIGEEVTVSFDIDCREWQGRWFNDIRAWKVERVVPGQAPAEAPVAETATPFPPASSAPVDFTAGNENDDLPF